jgi:outer membrane protein TolC
LERNGLIARNDLLRAQLQVSNSELSLLDAENNFSLSNLAMNLLIGGDQSIILKVDSSAFSQSVELKSVEELLASAKQNRNDRLAIDLRKKAAETGIKQAKTEYLPSLNLSAGYVAANIPNFITITNAINVGVGINYSISSIWKTKSKVQLAKSRADQVKFSEGILDDRIKFEINQSYLAWKSSLKKKNVYAVAIEQSGENYRIVKNKYNNSLASVSDLLDADVMFLQAKMNKSQANADAFVNYFRMLKAAGLLNTIK